jgi:5-methylcytosine-specific restriction endonuclease McrA
MAVVDHIIPLKDGGEPFSFSNLQSLCHMHHGQKTEQDKSTTG